MVAHFTSSKKERFNSVSRSNKYKMNGTKNERYSSNWEKLSKRLRLIYPCAICGEMDYSKKECHHLDYNKKNGSITNALILCIECHIGIHNGTHSLSNPLPDYTTKNSFNLKTLQYISEKKEWFDEKQPISIIPGLPAEIANGFRKQHIKGFIHIGGCNYYIGLQHCGFLIGVLGFSNPDYVDSDILIKADTTPPEWENSTDLLLYVLRTKQVQEAIEKKFNRKIQTAYSMCFSQHHQINRYRKHGKLIKKAPANGGFNLGYLFQLGNISTLKAAKSMWMQKHKT